MNYYTNYFMHMFPLTESLKASIDTSTCSFGALDTSLQSLILSISTQYQSLLEVKVKNNKVTKQINDGVYLVWISLHPLSTVEKSINIQRQSHAYLLFVINGIDTAIDKFEISDPHHYTVGDTQISDYKLSSKSLMNRFSNVHSCLLKKISFTYKKSQ